MLLLYMLLVFNWVSYPLCLSCSYNASVYCRDFICSVILGKDFIPRLGLVSMEDLKAKTLQCIANSKTPKVLINMVNQYMFSPSFMHLYFT